MTCDDQDRLRDRVGELEAAGEDAARMLRTVLQAYDENRMVRSLLTPTEVRKIIRSLEMGKE